ncbi:MAG: antibiotic biosynthesis monooxygenase [Gammaproteobacteria bacterium]|nr:antibiotic biosynthesis monooxygenase [Gammaproteobacteria bacterium]
MSKIAQTPDPPYYAVIFTSLHSDDLDGYAATAERMLELAAGQPGYLGVESARRELGITVSYWRDLESIKRWKSHAEHREAKRQGKGRWYRNYCTRIALVERDYGNTRDK